MVISCNVTCASVHILVNFSSKIANRYSRPLDDWKHFFKNLVIYPLQPFVNHPLLVDTETTVSVFPHVSTKPYSELGLWTADGSSSYSRRHLVGIRIFNICVFNGWAEFIINLTSERIPVIEMNLHRLGSPSQRDPFSRVRQKHECTDNKCSNINVNCGDATRQGNK